MAVDHEQRAGRLWEFLTNLAKTRDVDNYKNAADAIGIHHRPIRYALSPIQDYCQQAGLPMLTALLVSRTSGLPGHGFMGPKGDDAVLKEVWDHDWAQMPNPFAGVDNALVKQATNEIIADPDAVEKYFGQLTRGNEQRVFRATVLRAYGGECCVCGLSFGPALEAAHILPWASNPANRIDPRNGLLLCSTHHRLFDADCFTVTPNYMVQYNDPAMNDGPYSQSDVDVMVSRHGRRIKLPKLKRLWPNPDHLRGRGGSS